MPAQQRVVTILPIWARQLEADAETCGQLALLLMCLPGQAVVGVSKLHTGNCRRA